MQVREGAAVNLKKQPQATKASSKQVLLVHTESSRLNHHPEYKRYLKLNEAVLHLNQTMVSNLKL